MLAFGCAYMTSCSDLKEEIAGVESVATENSELIAALDKTVADLRTALAAAQADADAAMTEAKNAGTMVPLQKKMIFENEGLADFVEI